MGTFEGYVGIRLWDGQWVDDLLSGLLLVLLVCFALVYRANGHLFGKMLRDVVYVKERQNLFENSGGSDWLFRSFMIFQALALCGACLFSLARADGYLDGLTGGGIRLFLGLTLAGLLLFYACKRGFYYTVGLVFTDADRYKFWKTSYNAIMGAWGVSLYLPAAWLILVGGATRLPALLFLFSYILCRFAIIYKTIRIFHKKNSRFLYIILYLCGQEILPLFFLREGIIYLYNFIGSSTLWH